MSASACAARCSRTGARRCISETRRSTCIARGRIDRPERGQRRPGSGDLCFLIDGELDEVERLLESAGIDVELGPVEQTGAQGPLRSIYVRDPDGNLVELAKPL